MVLLTVVAVGLMTLSSISLRAEGQAIAEARANARLALMMAIGDLQKTIGPDKAITAKADILTSSPAKPNSVGVWTSPEDLLQHRPDGLAENDHHNQQTKYHRYVPMISY